MVRYQQWQKFSGCKCKCIILSALNLASTASSSAMWKAASYNSKGNRKVSWTLVSELLPEVAHSTHYICSQLTCKQSNWSRVTSRRASLVAPPVKNPPAMQERPWFNPWVRKIPWRRKWQPTPVFLPGKSHGQRSMVGYSPWSHKRAGHDLVTKHQQQSRPIPVQLFFVAVVVFWFISFQNYLRNVRSTEQVQTMSLLFFLSFLFWV